MTPVECVEHYRKTGEKNFLSDLSMQFSGYENGHSVTATIKNGKFVSDCWIDFGLNENDLEWEVY